MRKFKFAEKLSSSTR